MSLFMGLHKMAFRFWMRRFLHKLLAIVLFHSTTYIKGIRGNNHSTDGTYILFHIYLCSKLFVYITFLNVFIITYTLAIESTPPAGDQRT